MLPVIAVPHNATANEQCPSSSTVARHFDRFIPGPRQGDCIAAYVALPPVGDLNRDRLAPPSQTQSRRRPEFRSIRLTGRDGIARVLYVTAIGRRVVVVRAFVKKTQKTPRAEIELALRRAKEVT